MRNVKTSKRRKVEMAAALAAVLLAAAPARGQQVVAKLDGTSRSTFKVGATSAAPLSLQNVSGRLTLGNGLRVTAGTVDFSGATISGFSLTSGSLTGVTIDNSVIGGTTPAAGTFTSLTSASGALNGTIGGTTPAAGTFTSLTATSGALSGLTLNNSVIGGTTPAAGTFTSLTATGGALSGLTLNNSVIGGATPAAATFTALNSSGQYTNTVSTGTAPFVVSSTTKVTSLNADRVDSLDFANVTHVERPLVLDSGGAVKTTNWTAPTSGFKPYVILSSGSFSVFGGATSAGQVMIANGGNGFDAQTVSGDATLNSSGAIAISTGAVTSDKIFNGTIAAVDLSSAVKAWTPKPRIVATGAEAADTIRVSIVASSEDDAWLSSAQYMMSWVLLTTAVDPTTVYGGSPTVTYVDGKAWQTITADKQAWAYTDTTGQLTLDVTITGDVTVYLSVSLAGKTTFATLDFN